MPHSGDQIVRNCCFFSFPDKPSFSFFSHPSAFSPGLHFNLRLLSFIASPSYAFSVLLFGQIPLSLPGEEGQDGPLVRAETGGEGAGPPSSQQQQVRSGPGAFQVQVRLPAGVEGHSRVLTLTVRHYIIALECFNTCFLSRRSPSEKRRSCLSSSGQIQAVTTSLSPYSSPGRVLSPSASPASSLAHSR